MALDVSKDSFSVRQDLNYIEAEISELLETKVDSEDKAYKLYNQYAYKIGFGIRRHNYRYIANTEIIKGREFVCCKQGNKRVSKKSEPRAYTKANNRTNCKARIYFELDGDGNWVVLRHDMIHNHQFCPRDTVHLLKSHRQVFNDQVDYLKLLVQSGIDTSDAVQCFRGEGGGSPFSGLITRDAYNGPEEGKKKRLAGTDSNKLIQIFMNRQANETDFFFNFGLDDDSALVNFLWRDVEMKKDYIAFGPYLGVDSTYRINRYDLICVPFFGMNHHGQNCMFACGFILNETVHSYIWLFSYFLKCMGNVQPETVVTNESEAMAAAIEKVFPAVRHKLCTWRIAEDSKKDIKSLRDQQGFIDWFNNVLMYCDSIPEFESFWQRMMTEYTCSENEWLRRLYDVKEKWCPAYSKDHFSGGALSSLKSETTDNSISMRVTKTASLCDLYNVFSEVVSSWRRTERHENGRCSQGFPNMAIQHIAMLEHARSVYTIQAYHLFEEQYMIGLSCGQQQQQVSEMEDTSLVYKVWRPGHEAFAHLVKFDVDSHIISCTCKKFSECALLCCHCLRIFNLHYIPKIPEAYIVKRWTREAKSVDEDACDGIASGSATETASTWRKRMLEKFNQLLCASESNASARRCIEEAFEKARSDVELQIGAVYFSEEEPESSAAEEQIVLNPNKLRRKNDSIERKRSMTEGE